ncbi:hypothetical protein [Mycobacterium tuberculosis]|uniref:hypothetical protein n=1 Tax=Mycobacterium tuberculosis TaxID=1773 RepID=UPI00272AA607|nr:hypothetical protein [Mycobacterium tuberculosis]
MAASRCKPSRSKTKAWNTSASIDLLLRIGQERKGVAGASRVQVLLDGIEKISAEVGDIGTRAGLEVVDELESTCC